MDRVAPILVAALAVLTLGVSPAPARAQVITTFVSGRGDDTNPCTLAAPCRSLARAVLVTTAGGQVTMLDPAGYGAVTITRAISIVNDGGGEAGINAPGAGVDAIAINAGPGDVVNLRGLTLNGVGTGRNGIAFNSGAALNIQDSVIRGFAADGVVFQPSATAAITISDTVVSNDLIGVQISPAGGTTTAHLERVAAIDNANGGFFLSPSSISSVIQATIADSLATGNGSNNPTGFGFSSFPGSGGGAALINSKATVNRIGLVAGNGTTSISKMTLSGNVSDGFLISGGRLQSFGDNYIIDTTNSGSLTPIAAQ
jgi:hypothetical protein